MFIQFIINCFLAANVYALAALGFAIIYQSSRFFNFAHAMFFALGAYFAFLFTRILNFPFYTAIPLSLIISLFLGFIIDYLIFKSLRKRSANSTILLLSSFGIYIFLQNIISILFGDETKSIRIWEVKEGVKIFDAHITSVQIIIILTCLVLIIIVSLILKSTKFGKAMRAAAADPLLAKLSGIHYQHIISFSFGVGTSLACIAGILISLDMDLTPTMGMNMLLMGVVAMIISGSNNINYMLLSSFFLACAQNTAALFWGPQWQDTIAFSILLVFLLFKPLSFSIRKT